MHVALLLPMPISARRGISWGTGASVAIHLALALAAIWLSPLRELVAPPPDAVSVEIVSPAQFAALQAPASAPTAATPETTSPSPTVGGPADDASPTATAQSAGAPHATHRATTLYSADILREPTMARIRRTLTEFANSERIVQLCNIEGLEQIRRAESDYSPDALVAYAMSDTALSGLTLIATGAAFRSRRKWFDVSLTCTVAPDYQGVTVFEFTVGDAIPEEVWEAHNLNVEDTDE